MSDAIAFNALLAQAGSIAAAAQSARGSASIPAAQSRPFESSHASERVNLGDNGVRVPVSDDPSLS